MDANSIPFIIPHVVKLATDTFIFLSDSRLSLRGDDREVEQGANASPEVFFLFLM